MERTDLVSPERYNTVTEVEQYAKDKDKLALVYLNEQGERKQLTYHQLMLNVNKIGNIFLEKGLKRGDKILVMLPRIFEAYEVYLAGLKTGVIIVPSSAMLKTSDLQYRVTHGEINGIVSFHEQADVFKGLNEYGDMIKFSVGAKVDGWHFIDDLKESASDTLETLDTSKDDIAFLPYTSGTTGHPKAVIHTHSWSYAHIRTVSENWLDIREGDLVWATAAPGWQKWVWSPFMSTLGSGATGFIYDGKFNAEKYLSLLEEEKINVLCCTPTEYRLMAKPEKLNDLDLTHLHSAVSAGEPLNRAVIDVFQDLFDLTVRDGYGQTENTLLLGIMKDMDVKPGSMGKATPGNNVQILKEDGTVAPVGEVGDICVHWDCPALFKEYYKDEERTAARVRGDFYITGDRAYRDEDGYFWFEGRDDDIIISSGYTIGPFEIEDVLVKHEAVTECAVVASPDEDRGNIVKAFVILSDGFEGNDELVEQLQTYTKEKTAPYKYPRKIEFVKTLPKTSSGKIRRIELRQLEKERFNQ